MSTDETTTPKRRSSTAKRRRSTHPTTATVAPEAEEIQEATIATVETAEAVDRNAQRAAERKAAKAKKDQKSGISRVVDTKRFQGVRNFYDDTMSEIRKVIWPTRQQTINLTLLVMALALVVGTLLGGLDWTMLKIFEAIG
ncbi:MAG: preprotein translocase subunit SecE [Thermomicrobiales bacterium]|nr:preprotein translocase subunit SecE [Thermomicrobiales bacterium]MCO5223909.1 preprotein translocase subunit SecE [Thermomicrobiales bacterium]MCO5227472.1 preprotein translocase subunit SecE [Thermomicrobiales bacterium]